jgi:hypothetical protein
MFMSLDKHLDEAVSRGGGEGGEALKATRDDKKARRIYGRLAA